MNRDRIEAAIAMFLLFAMTSSLFALSPVNAQAYIQRIEDAVGVPIKWIGVGPERDATIRR
jgi:adenylosuccinate synthase